MAAPLIALAAVSTGLNLLGGFLQADAAKQQGVLARKTAQVDIEQSKLAEQDQIAQRIRTFEQDLGAARASYAGSGVSMAEGTPLLVFDEITRIAEQDVRVIHENAKLDQYRAQLAGAYGQQIAKDQANAAIISSLGSAGSTFLGLKR